MHLSQFTDYLLHEKKYSPHTVNAYERDLFDFSEFINETFEEKNLVRVNYSFVRSWIIHLKEKGTSNRTVNRKMSTLKTFYKFLLKTEQITVSPLAKHKSLKVSKEVQIPFSDKEIGEVIANFKAETFAELRNKLIVELLYSTGMRRAELMNLKMLDLNMSKAQIKVLGKRNKERIIPLISSVINTLQKYLRKREAIVETQFEYLLSTNTGKKTYDALIYRVVNSYFSRVSTKTKKSPHILRHSFATQLLNEGADLNSVKELLGHSSLASTQVYTHNSIKELSRVYQKSHPRNKE
jgi:integrase/recombinase XerC